MSTIWEGVTPSATEISDFAPETFEMLGAKTCMLVYLETVTSRPIIVPQQNY